MARKMIRSILFLGLLASPGIFMTGFFIFTVVRIYQTMSEEMLIAGGVWLVAPLFLPVAISWIPFVYKISNALDHGESILGR